MTRGEMIRQLFIPLDKILGYVRTEIWEIGGFDAWRNGCKTPGYDKIDIPYVIDCVQVRCKDIHSILGHIDIFHDRVVFTSYDDNNYVVNSKIDLTPFLDKGLTEENLFQYDVAYGFEGVTPRDLSIICMIAKLLVPYTEQDAYIREMNVQ